MKHKLLNGVFVFFTFAFTFLIVVPKTSGLYEDQAGKFDWHQKYFGKIRFILNDLSQPKRIIVGTEDNVIGAINSNTGVILYRHLFEPNGKLLYLGNYGEKSIISVSYSEPLSLVKIRTFITSSGIEKDQSVIRSSGVTHAGEFNGNLYLVNAGAKGFPEIEISTYTIPQPNEKGPTSSSSNSKRSKDPDFDDSKSDSEADRDPNTLKEKHTKKVNLGLSKANFQCQMLSQYFVCGAGNQLSIVHLPDGKVVNKMIDGMGGAGITEIFGTVSQKIGAVGIRGESSSKVFSILKEESGDIDLIPILSDTSGPNFLSISQGKLDDKSVLFVTKLESGHQMTMDIYTERFKKIDGKSLKIKASMLISSLDLTKSICVSSQCGLIGFTKDELLFGTKLDSSNTNIQVAWSRQECLASTIAVETVDYPSETEHTWNPYSATQGLVKSFFSRIKYEIESLSYGDGFYSDSSDRFGIRKVIVFVTSIGKVVGMDGISGQILYTFVLPNFKTFPTEPSVLLYLQRPAKYTPLKPLASIIYPSSNSDSTILFPFNPIEGNNLDEPQTFPKILQSQSLLHGSETTNFMKPIILMDINYNIHTYPKGFNEFNRLHFFLADKKDPNNPVLRGFQIKEDRSKRPVAKANWELSLDNTELLGVYGKLPCEKIHSQGKVLPDRSVSYKYMNPNLVAVVTGDKHDQGNINVILIDAVAGTVIHSFWHKKSRGPVHLVHSEHWVVYSLFNEKTRRVEIISVELYEGSAQSNSTAFSSFATPTIYPIVVKQSYIFPTKIDQMAYTRTEKGITNKDILIALPTGGVVELPRFIMQPRISPQHLQHIHQDEDGVVHSMPYMPELPIPPEMIINYNQSVKRIHGIKTWPTRLESTCLVLIYGKDIFYTKVAPSKHFDVLKDDFDHWFITLVLAALCVGAYVAKRFSAKKQLEQAWR